MTYPCPLCGAPASLVGGCPRCGRAPDPDAAEVVRLDGDIRRLIARRQAAAARVVAALPRPAATRPTSPALVQNALFLLGGVLLAVAAIVFTAVAWSQFGVVGRAAVLGVVTLAALAAPMAVRRHGPAAETFAAVGFLLLLCDGYAAWYVDLFGVAGSSAYGYAGVVCAVTAAIAVGYQQLSGLAAPRHAALVIAQPVLPLVIQPLQPDLTGWAFALAGVAAVNLLVLHLRPGILARVLGGAAVAGASLTAVIALLVEDATGRIAMAGLALVTAAAVLLLLARWAGASFVIAVTVAVTRLADHLFAPVAAAAVVAVVAVLVALLPVGRSSRVGGSVTVSVAGVVCLAGVAGAVLGEGRPSWQLPVSIVLLTAGMFALWRVAVVPVAGVAAALLATVYAAGLPPRPTAFVVLIVAAAVLFRRGRSPELAAHAGGLVALLLVLDSARYAAAVLALWGVALGARAWLGRSRTAYAVAAASAELAGCWLLLAANDVAVVEAYTLPAAAVALLAGRLLTGPSRTPMSSWIAYAPALGAALLPSLASVLGAEGQPLRRLLLGAGAVLVVLAGARAQLVAPVLIGGVVLVVLALHEAVLVSDLLPRWIPLAVAGLVLVGLAMTLERRRQDVTRLRAALHRMS